MQIWEFKIMISEIKKTKVLRQINHKIQELINFDQKKVRPSNKEIDI